MCTVCTVQYVEFSANGTYQRLDFVTYQRLDFGTKNALPYHLAGINATLEI
jgi:hypothetical protein